MSTHAHTVTSPAAASARQRIAGAFVLVVMALACTIFWVGIPAGGLWLLGELTDSGTTHFISALIGVPMAMALFAPGLFWLNGLYLRVTGILERLAEDEEESGWQRRVRGPLEPMLIASLAVELVALVIWFFFFAENPPRIII